MDKEGALDKSSLLNSVVNIKKTKNTNIRARYCIMYYTQQHECDCVLEQSLNRANLTKTKLLRRYSKSFVRLEVRREKWSISSV